MSHKKKAWLLISGFCLLLACIIMNCSPSTTTTNQKVLVLGIDGMDPRILKTFMSPEKMPNFSKLVREGCFYELGTSIPPQSPVAWSNFITGMNPGGHGIFDFIHRIPKNLELYLSTSRSEDAKEKINLGLFSIPNRFSIPFTPYHLPFSGGNILLMRKGKAFWEYLSQMDIPCSIFKIPSNYPPVQAGTHSISGMGTPDILGSYGDFSFYTDNVSGYNQEISGGNIYQVEVMDNRVDTFLYGPPNIFREEMPQLTVPLTIYMDRESLVGKIVLPDQEIILKQGEWSSWVQIDFQPIPYIQNLNGIVRFFLKEVYPDFKLYVSPINIDPSNPAMPISYPEDYARELYEKIGFFYTQGMAEDTKALSNGVLDNAEYLSQADFVFQERVAQLKIELDWFQKVKSGFLFFYFSSLDQSTHVFWRTMDHKSPAYQPDRDQAFTEIMEKLYQKMDTILGLVLQNIPDNTTLIVMSDHGFSPFYRSFQLNSWLLENGYLSLKNPAQRTELEYFENVDWNKTRAYALGLNGLYLNLKGREPHGIVMHGQERDALLEELVFKLKEIRDPESDYQVILDVYKTQEAYSGPYTTQAPDLIVGYNRGYRSAWESALGSFPTDLIKDNTNAWSGDHCMSPKVVPGYLSYIKREQWGQ
ncbi:alkaline phosphatase family protein, partial [candidate division CSSED10-310 bacterium]